MYRTNTCGELRIENVNEEVTLAGFIQKIREMGAMTFVDLKDHYGITQIVLGEDLKDILPSLTTQASIQVKGKVIERINKNPNLKTGDIEIEAKEIKILGDCEKNLPFEINEDYKNNREDLRLEYRFLDLRNEEIHQNIVLRSKILKDTRHIMDEMGFLEIQTPIFASSSPEGARDYLIPSRLHPGEFYALPQAPQQFKQLLMVSGFDKYYQIAPCFRDEDPRADRSPCEFYQLDFEMAFAEQEDVLKVLETFGQKIFNLNAREGRIVEKEMPRIKYFDALEKYGTDKPDLRNPLMIINVSEELKEVPFFESVVIAIKVDGTLTRKEYDNISKEMEDKHQFKVYYTKYENDEFTSGISKFITPEVKEKLEKKLGKFEDSSLFVVTGENKLKTQKNAGELRNLLGNEFKLIDENKFKLCFIVDFPMYELNDEDKLDFAHNPFSMPQGEMEALENKDPLDILAYQYDMVCNGYEIASGAVRNHDNKIMKKAFEIVGYDEEEVEKRFKALYNAFKFGPPPHAGAAPGLDRIIMLLAETTNIREIIAFPKNSRARDLMMNAPSKVTKEQLKDLHIKLDLDK